MKTEKQRLKRKAKQKKAKMHLAVLKGKEHKYLTKTDSNGNQHVVRNPWY